MYIVRRLKIGRSPQLDELALECGRLYSATVVCFWRTVRHQGLWLKASSMMRWLNIEYKNSAIRLRQGKLILSNGLGNEPLVLDWAFASPVNVKIQWTGDQYEAIATYKTGQQDKPTGENVAGLDLGEIHLAVAHDGEHCTIINGRIASSFFRACPRSSAKSSQTRSRRTSSPSGVSLNVRK